MLAASVVGPGQVGVREHPDPVPGAGEVLIRVHAAGINGADLMQARGLYPAPPGSPADILGLELAGEVKACGVGADRFRPGDRVMAVVGGGGQAELATVHERMLVPVPDGMEWTAAGGFPETFTTAHDALFSQAGLTLGERVLVHGAAGGVGVAAVQLASCAGARVTATVRSEAFRDSVRGLGAEQVLAPEDFSGAGPFNLILELVGAPNLTDNLEALAVGGRIVIIGIGAGARTEVDLRALMMRRGRLIASTLRARPLEEKALCARSLEAHVLPLVEAGSVTVPVAATFALDQVASAYERFAAGGKLGKVVIRVTGAA